MPPSGLPFPLEAKILPAPLSTPHHGPSGSFTVACSTLIHASPQTCLLAVLDTSTYPDWNRFVPAVDIKVSGTLPPPRPPATGSSTGSLSSLLDDHSKKRDEGTRGRLMLPGAEASLQVHMSLDSTLTIRTGIKVTLLEEFNHHRLPGTSSPRTTTETPTRGTEEAEGTQTATAMGRERKGYRVSWVTSGLAPSFLHLAERTQEFIEGETEGQCEYYCWETFYGVLGRLIRRVEGSRLERGFQAWMEGLRGFVEEEGGSKSRGLEGGGR